MVCYKTNFNTQRRTFIRIWFGIFKKISLVLSNTVGPPYKTYKTLCRHQNLQRVKSLLHRRISVNFPNSSNNTPSLTNCNVAQTWWIGQDSWVATQFEVHKEATCLWKRTSWVGQRVRQEAITRTRKQADLSGLEEQLLHLWITWKAHLLSISGRGWRTLKRTMMKWECHSSRWRGAQSLR